MGENELTRDQLQAANDALRRANARLARRWLGKADSAAASLLVKLQAEREELEVRLGKLEPRDPAVADRYALIKRVDQLHEQVLAQEQDLNEMRSSRAWQFANRYWSARRAIARALSRGQGRP